MPPRLAVSPPPSKDTKVSWPPLPTRTQINTKPPEPLGSKRHPLLRLLSSPALCLAVNTEVQAAPSSARWCPCTFTNTEIRHL